MRCASFLWMAALIFRPRSVNGWATRAGFAYNKAPVPDETVTPLLPDMDRYVFGLGVSLPVVRQWTLDASYLRVQTEGRRGRLADRSRPASAPPGTVVPAPPNTGFFELGANICPHRRGAQGPAAGSLPRRSG